MAVGTQPPALRLSSLALAGPSGLVRVGRGPWASCRSCPWWAGAAAGQRSRWRKTSRHCCCCSRRSWRRLSGPCIPSCAMTLTSLSRGGHGSEGVRGRGLWPCPSSCWPVRAVGHGDLWPGRVVLSRVYGPFRLARGPVHMVAPVLLLLLPPFLPYHGNNLLPLIAHTALPVYNLLV